MRVSDSHFFDSSRRAAESARARMVESQDRLSSGKRVVHPGDDPAAASLLVQQRFDEARHGQRIDTLARASDELDSVDAAMRGVNESLFRAKELAVQLSNDTYSAADRLNAVAEADGLLGQVVSLLNTDHGGRYLFGGTLDSAPPFDMTGAYSGDDQQRQLEIAPGVIQDVSIRADIAFKGIGGGEDTLQNLIDLREALRINDVATVRTLIARFDTSIAQSSTATSEVGAAMNILDLSGTLARDLRDSATKSAVDLADSDFMAESSRLAQAQLALQATLSSTATTAQISLLKKMG